jgi:hypothetical protein
MATVTGSVALDAVVVDRRVARGHRGDDRPVRDDGFPKVEQPAQLGCRQPPGRVSGSGLGNLDLAAPAIQHEHRAGVATGRRAVGG